MTPAEARRLSSQTWERERDRAHYTGYTLAILLRHWHADVEKTLLGKAVGSVIERYRECSAYRRIK